MRQLVQQEQQLGGRLRGRVPGREAADEIDEVGVIRRQAELDPQPRIARSRHRYTAAARSGRRRRRAAPAGVPGPGCAHSRARRRRQRRATDRAATTTCRSPTGARRRRARAAVCAHRTARWASGFGRRKRERVARRRGHAFERRSAGQERKQGGRAIRDLAKSNVNPGSATLEDSSSTRMPRLSGASVSGADADGGSDSTSTTVGSFAVDASGGGARATEDLAASHTVAITAITWIVAEAPNAETRRMRTYCIVRRRIPRVKDAAEAPRCDRVHGFSPQRRRATEIRSARCKRTTRRTSGRQRRPTHSRTAACDALPAPCLGVSVVEF